jgi:diguanylate cyclase (GGDEF)-like protein
VAARDSRKEPVSLLVIAIDDFEEYTNTFGSRAPGVLLKKTGEMVRAFGRRPGDLAARDEEDELALMLPGCSARNAARMAEALRKRVENSKIAHAGIRIRETVTVHIGVATIRAAANLSHLQLEQHADTSLNTERFKGGNKIIPYRPLSQLKFQRWNHPNDGPLSEHTMPQKLLVWGYDTVKNIPDPENKPRELIVDIEGHTMAVKAGDFIFIPLGIVVLVSVRGEKPVLTISATKNW